MQRARFSLTFQSLEPVLPVISSYLGNESITLRLVCQITCNLRATLECEKVSRIPLNLEKLTTYEVLPATVLPNFNCLTSITIYGRHDVWTSQLHAALHHTPLEEFTCSMLLQQDMGMDDFVIFLLQKQLTILQLDEIVSDTVTPLIGAHGCLRKLAISLDGSPSGISEIAKCKTLREVRLDVPETYSPESFAPFSKLPLTLLELNGSCSFEGFQPSLTELSVMSFFENEEVDLSRLAPANLTKLQLWCERAVGTLQGKTLEWLVMKVRDSWMTVPMIENLQVLSVNTLFTDDVETIALHSPLLRVFEFGLYYVPDEYVRVLVALSNIKLEYLGVYCESQLRLQGIKNVCHSLKVLVLDGEQPISENLRSSAAKKNIYFENSEVILKYAYPRHHLF